VACSSAVAFLGAVAIEAELAGDSVLAVEVVVSSTR